LLASPWTSVQPSCVAALAFNKPMVIRPARPGDAAAIWSIIGPTIRAGETYALDPRMSEADALAYWLAADKETFVAEDGSIVGTYFLRPNQAGGGAHVCNCGYMTSAAATGRGGRSIDVQALARPCEGSRLPSHAVQLRGEHQ
jgi:hypothetical protein